MAINSTEAYQEVLSLALEDRSAGYQDLVSDSQALLAVLKEKGGWRTYSGPKIRERLLYAQSGNTVWYSGFDFLANSPKEIFNDAVFDPKMCAVGVSLSNQDILNNEGEAQLMDMMEAHIEAAEIELMDEVDLSLHGDGTRYGGKELGGLQLAIPTVNNSGDYGGISRTNAVWQTGVYDVDNDFSALSGSPTQFTNTSIRPVLNSVMTARSRGKQGADLLLMDANTYAAYDAATVAIQRINDETSLGKLGFQSLKYYGAGRSAQIVQDGGIGSNMPANTIYGIDVSTCRVRYHPERNFNKIGKTMMPINQDASVQYIGFMGELTQVNPLFNWKLYDSDTGS